MPDMSHHVEQMEAELQNLDNAVGGADQEGIQKAAAAIRKCVQAIKTEQHSGDTAEQQEAGRQQAADRGQAERNRK